MWLLDRCRPPVLSPCSTLQSSSAVKDSSWAHAEPRAQLTGSLVPDASCGHRAAGLPPALLCHPWRNNSCHLLHNYPVPDGFLLNRRPCTHTHRALFWRGRSFRREGGWKGKSSPRPGRSTAAPMSEEPIDQKFFLFLFISFFTVGSPSLQLPLSRSPYSLRGQGQNPTPAGNVPTTATQGWRYPRTQPAHFMKRKLKHRE